MARNKSVHAVPKGKGWAVKKSGAKSASSNHRTQQAAWKVAKRAAKREGSEAFKHGRDGTIKERNSYGTDPYPPPG